MSNRSGIELMIDRACGIGLGSLNSEKVQKTEKGLEPEAQALLDLADSAKAWWESFRPEVYTLEEHLANPTVNHLDAQRDLDLCNAIAKWVNLGG